MMKKYDLNDGSEVFNNIFQKINMFKKLGDSSFKENQFQNAIYYYECGVRFIDKTTQDFLRLQASKKSKIL